MFSPEGMAELEKIFAMFALFVLCLALAIVGGILIGAAFTQNSWVLRTIGIVLLISGAVGACVTFRKLNRPVNPLDHQHEGPMS